ncbi:MAG: ABC transporter ATP-binding protein [Tissierellia bacterium]|nr:ABC transporter ATP-binding protein [Tissierellia bacterium]
MKRYSKFRIFMIATLILSAIISLVAPLLLNYWSLKESIISKDQILLLALVMMMAIFVQMIITFVRERFAKEFNQNNFLRYLQEYYKLPYDYINEEGPLNLLERMIIGVNSQYNYLTGDGVKIYSNIFTLGVCLLLVLTQSYIYFLLLLSMIPIQYLGFRLLNKELARRSQKLQEISSSNWRDVLSVIGTTDFVKQVGNHDELSKKVKTKLENIYTVQASLNTFAQSMATFLTGLLSLAQTMIMVYAIIQGLQSREFIQILLISVIVPLYSESLKNITTANINKREFDIANEFFEQWEKEDCQDDVLKEIISIDLKLEELNIGEHQIPCHINQRLEKGDICWVRGKSGSGKSTLLKLLPRFRDDDIIEINGKNIQNYKLEDLRNRLEYISQNVPIIKGSLRDNLFLDMPYSSVLEKEMCQDPLLQSILQTKTLDTEIFEGAGNLSGGEKQRIAMVRALYKDIDLLILDEITSGLDEETGNLIYDRVLEKMKDKIVLIVSHRDLDEKRYNKEIHL